jgi:hypothetical protein
MFTKQVQFNGGNGGGGGRGTPDAGLVQGFEDTFQQQQTQLARCPSLSSSQHPLATVAVTKQQTRLVRCPSLSSSQHPLTTVAVTKQQTRLVRCAFFDTLAAL